MGLNTKIAILRERLVADINASGLPACICDLILKEVAVQVRDIARADLSAEQADEPEKEGETDG